LKEIDCDSVLENLSDFIDEDQREELCQAIQEHLKRCRDCSVYVDTFRKMIVLYQGNAKAAEVPMKATASLTARMTSEYTAKRPPN
jgi:predicted anti-sigma-YlaC factor YlaD